MKKISLWARCHRQLARIIIVLIQLSLFVGAVYTGIVLQGVDIVISPAFLYLGLFLLIFFALLYPPLRRKRLRIHARYVRQKTRICGITVATFMCVCFLFNDDTRLTALSYCTNLQGSFVNSNDSSGLSSTTESKRLSRKALRKQLKEILKDPETEKEAKSRKIWGVILVITGGVILTLLVAALSCGIACGGAEALAIIVAIMGFTGIAFLLTWAIKKIIHRYNQFRPQTALQ